MSIPENPDAQFRLAAWAFVESELHAAGVNRVDFQRGLPVVMTIGVRGESAIVSSGRTLQDAFTAARSMAKEAGVWRG